MPVIKQRQPDNRKGRRSHLCTAMLANNFIATSHGLLDARASRLKGALACEKKRTRPVFIPDRGPLAYPRTAMRRAAATRPKKTPMKQANSSLVDIARLAKRAPSWTVCLRMSCAT
jgi:hypothetical protein